MRCIFGIMLLSCVSAASCDRRPEGPLMNRSEPKLESRDAAASGKGEGGRKRDRCMVPTPKRPPPIALPAKKCPPDPVFGGVTMDKATLTFVEAEGEPTIEVEMAITPRQRQRGMMYRTHLDESAGMLFDFPGREEVQSFWMRNTCVPLDMLFITADGFIAGIIENVPTLNDGSRSIPCPVRYVLEVNAGWTRKHGVRAGQFVKLPEVE